MKILIACEFSGVVRNAFRKRGYNAWSCDLLPTDADPTFHRQGDVYEMLDEQWDLIIAHPPCTALAVSGNAWYGECKPKYNERLDSVKWTKALWEACKKRAKRVCFENPVGVLTRLGGLPRPSYVQPHMFGHPEQKKTGLILHNLPPLTATNDVYEEMILLPDNERQRLHYLPPSKDRWKIRSTTFQGIADAMAEQWGSL